MLSPAKRSTKSPARSVLKEKDQGPRLIRGKVSDSGLESMIKRKENLIHCFEIYELLFENNTPQKCVVHNNFVTLYCQNEHKLLCVNCIYGCSTHANHKVVPIKNALKKIQNDNSIMKKHLRHYIDQLKTFQRNNSHSKEQSDTTLKAIMFEIQDQYNLAMNALEEKFFKLKQSVVRMFENDSNKMGVLMEQVSWMKESYIQKQKMLPSRNEESELLFCHMMLGLMLENDNLREARIENTDFTESKVGIQNEFRKIIEVIMGGGYQQSSPVKKRTV